MNMSNRNFLMVLFLLVGAPLGVSACASATPTPTPVTVQLAWTHQAQFAGIYAADQKGFYSAEGLRVTLLQGGAGADLLTPVLNGAAQFGITNGDPLVLARADGKPLRAIATVLRRSAGVYIALTTSGITKPTDFIGKRIQVAPRGVPILRTMTSRAGLRPDQYTVVDSTADLQPFYTGQVDIRSVFLTNEVLTAQAAGYKLNIIFPDDYGVHFLCPLAV